MDTDLDQVTYAARVYAYLSLCQKWMDAMKAELHQVCLQNSRNTTTHGHPRASLLPDVLANEFSVGCTAGSTHLKGHLFGCSPVLATNESLRCLSPVAS
jgi:hypothetical protein